MFGPEKLKNNNELGCVQRSLSFLFEELSRRKEEKQVSEFKVLLHFVQLYRGMFILYIHDMFLLRNCE